VPAAVIATTAAVTGGVVIAGASSPDLPEKDAAELLADVHNADAEPFSGTVVQTSRLDFPELPGLTETRGDLSLLSMLTGSNTARIWYTSPEQLRFSLMGTFDELTVIRDNADVWLWTSDTNEAEHITLPPAFSPGDYPIPDAMAGKPLTPDEAAAVFLDELDPSTEISVDGTAEVAGRPAYELVISPRDDRSLIESISLAIDADTTKILRFEINTGDADEPAFEVGFTSVSFTEPSEDVYRFNPPEGAQITEHSMADIASMLMRGKDDHRPMLDGAPTVIGEGWTSVLVVPGLSIPAGAEDEGLVDALLSTGTEVSGAYGSGRLFTTALVSALWLDDGTLLIGALTPDALEEAAIEVSR
jgi:outer membrane lipoprotein-sorting protein